ncbi:putative PAN domain protein, partial [Trichinella spiralis]
MHTHTHVIVHIYGIA